MELPKNADNKAKIMEMKPGTYFWCACGSSKNQPFCDGSHKGTVFVPMKVEINEDKKVAWCMCKLTKNKPFCDGSHKDI